MLNVREAMKNIPSECDTVEIFSYDGLCMQTIGCYGTEVQDYIEDNGDSIVDSYAYEDGVFHLILKMSKKDLEKSIFKLMDKMLFILRQYDKNIDYYSCCFIDKNDSDDDDTSWFNMTAKKNVDDDTYINITKRW